MFDESEKDILERLKTEKEPAVRKLAERLAKRGISYRPNDGALPNAVFHKGGDEYRIAHETFFRMNGRCVIWEQSGKKEKIVPLPDDEFYRWVEMLALVHFKIETM